MPHRPAHPPATTWPLLLLLCVNLASAVASAADPSASLRPHLASRALAGAVTLVLDRDGILSHQAIGMADLAKHEPMAPDALFWIASMSKPLTAAVLMMLVDEGRVEIEAPVSRYLPEFASMRVRSTDAPGGSSRAEHAITVRHVLAHTSGLPFVLPEEGGKLDVLPIAESVARSAALPLDFEPGSAWSYSNCGINVAGRIIEVVTGRAFEDVMRERLFAPLGMVDTTSFPSARQVARLAKAYEPAGGKQGALAEIPIRFLSYPLEAATRFACPGGGFFSTATDLAHFARMILRGGEVDGRRYLSSAAVARMTSVQTGTLAVGYGLGFAVMAGCFGHGGAYHTDLWFDGMHGLATIFLVQHESFAGIEGEDLMTDFKQAAVTAYGRR